MTTKRRNQIVIGIIVVLTLCMGLTVYSLYQNGKNNEQLKIMGEMDAEKIINRPAPSGEVVLEGAHFIVHESEIQDMIERLSFLYDNDDNVPEQAVQYLAELNSIYQTALEDGYDISEQDISDAIEADKATYEENGTSESFDVYIEAMGITTQEYWELMQTDADYRRDIVVERYLKDRQDALYKDVEYEEDSEEGDAAWQEHQRKLVHDAMQRENARIVSADERYSDIDLYAERA